MTGVIIGIITFLMIGVFHPVVIKGEYYFGAKKPSILFAILGVLALMVALLTTHIFVSIFLGVLSCCFFWSIKEFREQEERVLKGWFPENPKRSVYYDTLRLKNEKIDE